MAPTKQYKVLTIQDRLNVLKDIQETSLSIKQIAAKYGVVPKTINRIQKNAVKISSFAEKSERAKRRRRIVDPLYKELDTKLLAWFTERKTLGHRITDALMMKKAIEIKGKLPAIPQCKASMGWLTSFKARHGIRLVKMRKENARDDAETFVMSFKQMIQKENINAEHIYSMHESRLAWKALPSRSLAGEEEENASGCSAQKDRITITLCTNATGTHKMKPLVVYKYNKNRAAFYHQISLPAILKTQTNARMTKEIFLDWFENHFKPSVRKQHEDSQTYGKVILLIDDREEYKVSVQEDKDFKIVYLPQSKTSRLQPIAQGILEKLKTVFRHKLLRRAIAYNGGVNEFCGDYTLGDCIYFLSDSWWEITQENISNAWNKVLGRASPSIQPAATLELDWQDMMSILIGEKCTSTQVTKYLSQCKEAEESDEVEVEEPRPKEEPLEEPEEMIFEGSSDPVTKNELSKAFETITFFSARAPPHIRLLVLGLKTFFLGKES